MRGNCFLLALSFLVIALSLLGEARAARRPNVVIILADDMGFPTWVAMAARSIRPTWPHRMGR